MLPTLSELVASKNDLMSWSDLDLLSIEGPEATIAEGLSRIRELQAVLGVAQGMLEEEASRQEVDALCDYLSAILEELLFHELAGCSVAA